MCVTYKTKHYVEAEWNEQKGDFVKTDDCGTTLKEFLEKKANKNKQ